MVRRRRWSLPVVALAALLPVAAAAADRPSEARGYDLEVSARARALSIPKAVLDVWFFDDDDAGWPLPDGRPRAHGQAFGLELVIRSKTRPDSAHGKNGIFYVEWVHSGLREGYWDDIEEPPTHLDGDWLTPSANFGFVTAGVDYAWELHLVKSERTNGRFGLSAMLGGGLGTAWLIGNLHRANACLSADCPDLPSNDNVRFGRVLPLIDANLGLRLTFVDRLVLRLEGGLHTVLYLGATAGVRF